VSNNRLQGLVDAVSSALTNKDFIALLGSTSPAAGAPISGWELIRETVKLFRTDGNEYERAVGHVYQSWCRWTGKRDRLKGLTRVVGVRPEAWAKMAKVLLLAAEQLIGKDGFFEWYRRHKQTSGGENNEKLNRLELSVKAGLACQHTRKHLWLIAVLSDGLFQPLMIAINEDPTKNMLSMRPVARLLNMLLRQWTENENIPALIHGWYVGGLVQSEFKVDRSDIIAGAAALAIQYGFLSADDHSIKELPFVSARMRWNMLKRTNVSIPALQYLLKRAVTAFENFWKEYLPGGAFYKPSKDVAAVAFIAPNNNDGNERDCSQYKFLTTFVAVNMLTANKEARVIAKHNKSIEWLLNDQSVALRRKCVDVCRTSAEGYRKLQKSRKIRDDEIKRLRAVEQQRLQLQREQKRTEQKAKVAKTVVLATEDDVRRQLKTIKSESGKQTFLKEQLRVYKLNHKDKDIRFSEGGEDFTSDQLTGILFKMIAKYPSTASSPSSSASSSSSSSSSSAQITQPKPKRNVKRRRKPSDEVSYDDDEDGEDSRSKPTENDNEGIVLACCRGRGKGGGDECVQCDWCKEWYHCDCEGIEWETANAQEEYYCNDCRGDG
jgi:hypothetical protein